MRLTPERETEIRKQCYGSIVEELLSEIVALREDNKQYRGLARQYQSFKDEDLASLKSEIKILKEALDVEIRKA